MGNRPLRIDQFRTGAEPLRALGRRKLEAGMFGIEIEAQLANRFGVVAAGRAGAGWRRERAGEEGDAEAETLEAAGEDIRGAAHPGDGEIELLEELGQAGRGFEVGVEQSMETGEVEGKGLVNQAGVFQEFHDFELAEAGEAGVGPAAAQGRERGQGIDQVAERAGMKADDGKGFGH